MIYEFWKDPNIQALVLFHVARFFSLGDVVGVLGAGRSGNRKKSSDLCETHDDDDQGMMIMLLSRDLVYWE